MKWLPDLPLHLKQDDMSADAGELRFHLYQAMVMRTGGRGFRTMPGTSPKRKHPRRGRRPGFNRMESILIHVRYGERNAAV